MSRNFNVVFPIADLCLGTLLLRAPNIFKQPTGPSVPDVQPITPNLQDELGGKRCPSKGIGLTERVVTWLMAHHPVPWIAKKIKRFIAFS